MSEQQQTIKCAVVIGVREDNSVFLETHGTEQNLITIEGLLGYGNRYVNNEWSNRKKTKDTPAPEETQPEAVEEIETVEAEPVQKPKRVRKEKEVIVDAEVQE